jgi:hypothetical protein
VHGQLTDPAVVKVHVTGDGIAFPLVSLADTLAVYATPAANAADGVNVAVCVEPLYDTCPATAVPEPSFTVNTNDDDDTASENVADGATDVDTPVAPAAGLRDVTDGGVVSPAPVDEKIGSTQ